MWLNRPSVQPDISVRTGQTLLRTIRVNEVFSETKLNCQVTTSVIRVRQGSIVTGKRWQFHVDCARSDIFARSVPSRPPRSTRVREAVPVRRATSVNQGTADHSHVRKECTAHVRELDVWRNAAFAMEVSRHGERPFFIIRSLELFFEKKLFAVFILHNNYFQNISPTMVDNYRPFRIELLSSNESTCWSSNITVSIRNILILPYFLTLDHF